MKNCTICNNDYMTGSLWVLIGPKYVLSYMKVYTWDYSRHFEEDQLSFFTISSEFCSFFPYQLLSCLWSGLLQVNLLLKSTFDSVPSGYETYILDIGPFA